MTVSQLPGIPIDHLIAELASFPLATPDAVSVAPRALSRDMDAGSGETTGDLWRAAEQVLVGQFPSLSLDQLVAVRDRVWFGTPDRAVVPLASYLREIGRTFLEPRGPTAMPRIGTLSRADGIEQSGNRGADARRAWRWVSLALPPDLLLASFNDMPSHVEILTPALKANLRDLGFAECHLHIGAALYFRDFWVIAQHAIIGDQVGPNHFASPGAQLDEGRSLASWLIIAMVARRLLAEFLARRHSDESLGQFYLRSQRDFLTDRLGPTGESAIVSTVEQLQFGAPPTLTAAQLNDWKTLLTLYGELDEIPPLTDLEALQSCDWISRQFENHDEDFITPEMRLINAGLAYLESEEERPPKDRDQVFPSLFWQVVRVRCLFYRHVVQRPMTPGLQWFVRFFSRIGPGRRDCPPSLIVESAARMGGIGEGLRALEVRTSPRQERKDIHRMVVASELAVAQLKTRHSVPELEFGYVLHLTKDRGGGARLGRPMAHGHMGNASPDPSVNPLGYRFQKFYRNKRQEARAFADTLHQYPLSLFVLRGIDAASDELGVPAWVLAPLFRHVRRVSEESAATLLRLTGIRAEPLRTTVHAGEDFVHLMSGLRRIDEAFCFFDLREHDRIGHGVALGIDAVAWAEQAQRVALPREERFFNLIWEWSWYARKSTAPAGRALLLEHEISRLARAIFEISLTPSQAANFCAMLHDENFLMEAGFPDGPRPGKRTLAVSPEPFSLLCRYLTDPNVFRRGQEIEWVETSDEATALLELQTQLRGELGQRAIAVEINPTSNLLIGDLGDFEAHPLWRLNSPRPDASRTLAVCIGSDDPLTFATQLRDEYQYVRDAIVLAGETDERAGRWLDRARQWSLETRFTVPLPQHDVAPSEIVPLIDQLVISEPPRFRPL